MNENEKQTTENPVKTTNVRCHTCKETKDISRFYTSKRTMKIDKYKCKDCYKLEFQKILRESPL